VEAVAPAAAPAPAAAAVPAAPPPPPPPSGPAPRADGRVIATPYAKQLAKKHKVDLTKLGGTGPNGRITASDVERAAGIPSVRGANGAAPAPAPVAAVRSSPPYEPFCVSLLKDRCEEASDLCCRLRRTVSSDLTVYVTSSQQMFVDVHACP
jgi:pyruvate/2-oxoglutarate dehydrogenase complex dihydrolipoamide acyltransferase (E2) component